MATFILIALIELVIAFRQKQTPKQRLVIVIYRTPQMLSPTVTAQIKAQIKASLQGIFEDSRVLVVDGGATLEIHEAA